MSTIGGLLASALAGGARGGVAMADKISTEKRAEEGLLATEKRQNERQDVLLDKANARQDKQIEDQNQFTLDRDSLQHQRNLTLTSIKNQNKQPKSYAPKPNYGDDGEFLGSYNPNTNTYNKAGSDGGSRPGIETLIRGGGKLPGGGTTKESIAASTTDNRSQYQVLKEQEDAADLKAEQEKSAAEELRLSNIGKSVGRKSGNYSGMRASEIELERDMVEQIIRTIESGKTVSRSDIDLLKSYDVPTEIMLKARATF